ncbi:J domain-containing protein [Nocardia sp. NBC_01503]|uniref:J domain-containing protein n=1 Tax=Nocardia sp. NBC_01503 TaxID=2975997 RepID=UPI002E7C48DA|nr:J domain-containing protein [Nocardia sp. NBC_01503]WTL30390.1 J domain-containing protein [Nocardia sp. NBC_01503]
MTTVRDAAQTIRTATRPEDLFGSATADSDSRTQGRRRYHRLAAQVHPDRAAPGEIDLAHTAFERLAEMYRQWSEADAAGMRVTGARATYPIGALHARGTVADLYRSGPDRIVKIPRRTAANKLLAAERNALRDIAIVTGEHEWLRPYFPQLVDAVDHRDLDTGAHRTVNVLNALNDGFVTLEQVRAEYPDGLDPRDYAWMHRRLLRCVSGAALAGWAHTAISPANVLIHPRQHGVVLVGWSFATRPGTPVAATFGSIDYPPEIHDEVSPATDVHLAHRLMLTMLGRRAPTAMRTFAAGCMQPDPRLRPEPADLLGEFDDLLDRLYGQRRFRPFELTKG